MDRRTFLLIFATAGGPLTVEAQGLPVRARIGVFFLGSPPGFQRPWGWSFSSALANLGWVEGQNLSLEWRHSEDRDDGPHAIVEEFVRLKVDVIVVESTPESVIAKRVAKTTPLVMVLMGDPIGSGLVESLVRPGRNITGTSLMMTDTNDDGHGRETAPAAHRGRADGSPGGGAGEPA